MFFLVDFSINFQVSVFLFNLSSELSYEIGYKKNCWKFFVPYFLLPFKQDTSVPANYLTVGKIFEKF